MIQVQMGWNYDLENRVNGFAISFLGSEGFKASQMTMKVDNGRRRGKMLSFELDGDFKLNLQPHVYFKPLDKIVKQLSCESSPVDDEEFEPANTLGIDAIKKVRDFFLSDSTVLLPLFLRGSDAPWDKSKWKKPDDFLSTVLWSMDSPGSAPSMEPPSPPQSPGPS